MLRRFTCFATLTMAISLTQAQLKWPGCDDLKETDFKITRLETGKTELMSLEVSKDGRVFYTEKHGTVNMYLPKENRHVEIGSLAADFSGYMGLWGIALDPKFPAEPYIYLYYTPKWKVAPVAGEDRLSDFRLSRFQFLGEKLDLTSEKILFEVPNEDTYQVPDGSHTGGKLRFDIEGNLYLSTGDNRYWGDYPATNETLRYHAPLYTSGNTNDLRGKILRIHPEKDGSYTIPNGNLFPKAKAKTRPEIYAMGMRNPIGLQIDPFNGWVLASEAGADGEFAGGPLGMGGDEYHIFKAPGNGGWPMFYAMDWAYPHRDYTTMAWGAKFDPLHPVNDSKWNTGLDTLPPHTPAVYVTLKTQKADSIGFNGGAMASQAGPIYRYDPASTSTAKFPPHFHGKWIVGNFYQAPLGVLTLDSDGKVIGNTRIFANTNFGNGVLEMGFGSDGILYVLAHETGVITKLEYQGACRPTEAAAFAVSGCRDQAYTEFNPYANSDGIGACKTLLNATRITMPDRHAQEKGPLGIRLPGNGRYPVEVFDMRGQRLWKGELESGSGIAKELSAQAGLYWVRIATSNGLQVRHLFLTK